MALHLKPLEQAARFQRWASRAQARYQQWRWVRTELVRFGLQLQVLERRAGELLQEVVDLRSEQHSQALRVAALERVVAQLQGREAAQEAPEALPPVSGTTLAVVPAQPPQEQPAAAGQTVAVSPWLEAVPARPQLEEALAFQRGQDQAPPQVPERF